MKKRIIVMLALVAVTAALLLSNPLSVLARSAQAGAPPPPPKSTTPAEGSWSWDNAEVTGTLIPQYQLAPTNVDDYAVLQSEGIHLSGATQLCRPYPGGQSGWNAEIRVLTSTGWQSVPTVNQWVPDVEGKFMTCANVWSSGTYAVFGYWEKPDGWVEQCVLDLPTGYEFINVGPVATFDWASANPIFAGTVGDRCYPGGRVETDHLFFNGVEMGSAIGSFFDHYCACDSMYKFVVQSPE